MNSVKRFLPISLILFFVLFSMVPTFYEFGSRDRIKPLRYFELVHNFPTDYNLYLSKIRQGKEGAWLAQEKYTSEPHSGSLSQILYVFIGRVSDWLHVQTPYVWFSYHVMRVFFAVVFLFAIWKLVEWVFPSFAWQILTFVLVVTASTWPKFESVDGWPRFGGFMPWYTVIDSLQRTTFLPHVMLGQAMLIFILWVFSGGFITKKKTGNWVFVGIIGIILGVIFPPALAFLYGVLFFWSVWDIAALLWNKRKELKNITSIPRTWKLIEPLFITNLFGRILFVVMTAPTILYYSLLFTQYPWKRLVEFDVLHPTKFSYIEYFLALGATLPLGLIGMAILFLTRKSIYFQKLKGMVVWVFAWLFFMFLLNYIPQQSPTRFTEMVPHVPLGIFTAYGFYVLITVLAKRSHKSTLSRSAGVREGKKGFSPPDLLLFIPLVIILLGLGTMYSSWMWQKDFVDHKLRADIPLVPEGAEVMYPLRDLVDAMVWLQVYSPREVVVFSGEATGNMIPVYSGNTTYIGHANTVNAEIKAVIVANFFGRKRPPQEFLALFKDQNIQYIIYGPEERELAYGADDLTIYYPFLTEAYHNTLVKVYKVNW